MKPFLAKYHAADLDTTGRLCRMNPAVHGLEGDFHPGDSVNSYNGGSV